MGTPSKSECRRRQGFRSYVDVSQEWRGDGTQEPKPPEAKAGIETLLAGFAVAILGLQDDIEKLRKEVASL